MNHLKLFIGPFGRRNLRLNVEISADAQSIDRPKKSARIVGAGLTDAVALKKSASDCADRLGSEKWCKPSVFQSTKNTKSALSAQIMVVQTCGICPKTFNFWRKDKTKERTDVSAVCYVFLRS
jgi:hypothetical protein